MGRGAQNRTGGTPKGQRALTAGLVLLGLVLSAATLSFSETGQAVGWLGLVSLLPLFTAIRLFAPPRAVLAGGFWGACVWLFIRPALDAGTTAALPALVWMVLTSGAFAGLASFLHHRLRLGPLHLALAYLLFEVALLPLDLGLGLLAATQAGSTLLGVFGSLFGYLLVAFLIAYFDAVLLSLVFKLQLVIRKYERHLQTVGPYLSSRETDFVWIAYPIIQIFARPPPQS